MIDLCMGQSCGQPPNLNEMNVVIYIALYLLIGLLIAIGGLTTVKVMGEYVDEEHIPLFAAIALFWPLAIIAVILVGIAWGLIIGINKLTDELSEAVEKLLKK